MYKISKAELDKKGRAVRITALNDEDGSTSEVIISADFVFLATKDMAGEFAAWMKERGDDVKPG